MKALAVIGANWGDEGKGHVTDYLCAREGVDVVVRFNGGAQAGHTVVLDDGTRHVFHHFGSGTFAGAATYLSPRFVCNPLLFMEEWNKLEALGYKPNVYVADECYVTTPWDMYFNQLQEDARGTQRHGSCGIGFGDTIQREQEDTHFTVSSCHMRVDRLHVYRKCARIRDYYCDKAIDTLGKDAAHKIHKLPVDPFIDACNSFSRLTGYVGHDFISNKKLLFEGAQGLKLDMDDADFPHVTRSKTDLTWALEMAHGFGIDEIDAYFVTRTYFTRHGAGPFPGECPMYLNDRTNVKHPYQGELRYAPASTKYISKRVSHAIPSSTGTKVRPHVAITCTDHLDGVGLVTGLTEVLQPTGILISDGPKRGDIRGSQEVRHWALVPASEVRILPPEPLT